MGTNMASDVNPDCWLSVVTGAMDINVYPDCGRFTDPDITYSSRSDPENTIASGGSAGHSDSQGPGSSVPWIPTKPHVVAQNLGNLVAFGDNIGHHQHRHWLCWSRPRHDPWMSPWPQVAVQATQTSIMSVVGWPLNNTTGTRQWPRPQAFSWPSVVTGVMD